MILRTASAMLLAAPLLGLQPVRAGPDLPADAKAYVTRRMGCNHWGGEDAYDAARGREIGKAVRSLRCETVEADGRRLRRRYRRQPDVLKTLDQTHEGDG